MDVPAQRLIDGLLALALLHKHLLPTEPPDVLLQTAWHGVHRAHARGPFLLRRVALYAVFPEILEQMVKGHIVTHIAMGIGIIDLRFFGNARPEKGQLVMDAHIVFSVDGGAQHGTLHRHQLGQQLRQKTLNVSDHRRAGLGNAALQVIFLYVVQIGPGGDIGAESDAEHVVDAHMLQSAQNALVFSRIIGFQRRSIQHGNLLSCPQVRNELFQIVLKSPGVMLTGIEAGTAGDTLGGIHLNTPLMFSQLHHMVGRQNRAGGDTTITANAPVCSIDQLSQRFHPLSIFSLLFSLSKTVVTPWEARNGYCFYYTQPPAIFSIYMTEFTQKNYSSCIKFPYSSMVLGTFRPVGRAAHYFYIFR